MNSWAPDGLKCVTVQADNGAVNCFIIAPTGICVKLCVLLIPSYLAF